jgi:hypothetical protein
LKLLPRDNAQRRPEFGAKRFLFFLGPLFARAGLLQRIAGERFVNPTLSGCEVGEGKDVEVWADAGQILDDLLDGLGVMHANAIAMKRRGAAKHDAIFCQLDLERRNPGFKSKVRDVLLEEAQSFTPDLGRKGHSTETTKARTVNKAMNESRLPRGGRLSSALRKGPISNFDSTAEGVAERGGDASIRVSAVPDLGDLD